MSCETAIKLMKQEDVNNNLIRVINEAQELKLPVPDNICREVIINPRPKKRYGCCRKKDGKFQIEISQFVLQCEPDKIRGVLAHEVLHTCEDCYNHGNKWKLYAKMMNERYGYDIKRTSTNEDMGIPQRESGDEATDKIKYIIKCESCGREYPRQRFTCVMKKINAYRCSCGGKLTLLEKANTEDKG